MTTWQFLPKPDIFPDLLAFTGDPLLVQLLAQRGLTSVDQARAFLDPDAYYPALPTDLTDLETAVNRLNQALQRQELIGVWAILTWMVKQPPLCWFRLAKPGRAGHIYIPNRLTESHGIKIPALRRMLAEGSA